MRERVAKLLGPEAAGLTVGDVPLDLRAHPARARSRASGCRGASRSTTPRDSAQAVRPRGAAGPRADDRRPDARRAARRIDREERGPGGPRRRGRAASDADDELRAVRLRSATSRSSPEADALDFDDLLLVTRAPLREHPDVLRALPRALPVRPRRRVPGHEPRAVRAREAARGRAPRTSAWSATTTSRSTAGAAPTSATSSTSSADFPGAQGRRRLDRRTTARRGRSSPPRRVIANNLARTRRRCATERGEGEPIRLVRARDERDEAQFVVRRDPRGGARAAAALRPDSPSSTARTRSRGPSKRSCSSATCRTSSSAACASTSAPR